MPRALMEMTTSELLEIDRQCGVCNGNSPIWDGHDVVPPCVATARDEIVFRSRVYDKLIAEAKL